MMTQIPEGTRRSHLSNRFFIRVIREFFIVSLGEENLAFGRILQDARRVEFFFRLSSVRIFVRVWFLFSRFQSVKNPRACSRG
ncbi:MAG: hypothetical protein ACUVWO_07165 [Thermodesulfobacteriota bacterium]